jgi:hypothetical protein
MEANRADYGEAVVLHWVSAACGGARIPRASFGMRNRPSPQNMKMLWLPHTVLKSYVVDGRRSALELSKTPSTIWELKRKRLARFAKTGRGPLRPVLREDGTA